MPLTPEQRQQIENGLEPNHSKHNRDYGLSASYLMWLVLANTSSIQKELNLTQSIPDDEFREIKRESVIKKVRRLLELCNKILDEAGVGEESGSGIIDYLLKNTNLFTTRFLEKILIIPTTIQIDFSNPQSRNANAVKKFLSQLVMLVDRAEDQNFLFISNE